MVLLGVAEAVDVRVVVRIVLGSVRTGVQEWQIELDTAGAVCRLE